MSFPGPLRQFYKTALTFIKQLNMYYLYAKFHLIWANNNWAMLQFTIQ